MVKNEKYEKALAKSVKNQVEENEQAEGY